MLAATVALVLAQLPGAYHCETSVEQGGVATTKAMKMILQGGEDGIEATTRLASHGLLVSLSGGASEGTGEKPILTVRVEKEGGENGGPIASVKTDADWGSSRVTSELRLAGLTSVTTCTFKAAP